MIIFILSALRKSTNFYADLLRPIVVINLLSQLRFSSLEFLKDLRASLLILWSIFTWVFFFSLAGFYLFRFSFEGMNYFMNLSMSFESMFIALTTANFPDIMLNAYYDNYFVFFFFMIYLLIGIFFLISLFTAHVFNNYKNRLEGRIE